MRREFPAKVKVAAFERSLGLCEKCRAPLRTGQIHYDHVIPDALGGEPTIENCEALCASCHRGEKTPADVRRIAKAKRQAAAHWGAKQSRNPMPGSKASGWRKRMDGRVERRSGR